MSESNVVGDKDGIELWNHLAENEKFYFKMLVEAAAKYQSIFFSNSTEQRKKILNNQKIYNMTYDQLKNQWVVSSFHTPSL